jgi:putative PIN family toxin of toxin-antitoxin system
MFTAALSPRGGCGRVLDALKAGRFEYVTSAPMLEELGLSMARTRPGQSHFIAYQDAEALIALLHAKGEFVRVTGTVHGCRDPRDDVVIETALRGGASCIVSSDKDVTDDPPLAARLLQAGVRILTVAQFLAELDREESELPA